MTNDADRQTLLRIARDAIAAHIAGRRLRVVADRGLSSRMGAAFVSLHSQGDLRGCIGHLGTDQPLVDVIARCAADAGSADPRFPPVTAHELATVQIELSLLGQPEPITGPDDIEVGTHGLMVELGRHRGLLLPQVATERHWDRETFLTHTCQKAGLSGDAWQHGAKLWRFEAEVFGESGLQT